MQPWQPALVLCLISVLTTTLYYFKTPDTLNAKAQNNASLKDTDWGHWGEPDAEFNCMCEGMHFAG